MSYCNGCNKELPDGTTECPNCGAYVSATSEKKETDTAEPQVIVVEDSLPEEDEAPVQKPKKKFNWVSLVVWLLVIVIGVVINTWRTTRLTVDVSDSSNPSAEYTKIFEDAGITPDDNYKDSDQKHVAYALLDTDGCVYQQEYGLRGDTIISFVETAYLPLDGYNEADKTLLDKNIRESYAEVEALDFATVTYTFEGNYYKVKIKFVDFDKWENIKAAAATEIYADDVSGEEFYYSIKETEDGYLEQGYAKK